MKIKARYIGPAPVVLGNGTMVKPGDLVDIEAHELERPDFEEVTTDAEVAEAGVSRSSKTSK